MIRSISISGYRGLREFHMEELGRINLLVGKNNSGKTSVLEALQLLAEAADSRTLWQILRRRGEVVEHQSNQQVYTEFDLSHLFFGHELWPGTQISISTKNKQSHSINLRIEEMRQSEFDELLEYETSELSYQRLFLRLEGHPIPSNKGFPLTSRGGVNSRSLRTIGRPPIADRDYTQTQYISTESLSPDLLMSMWNDIVLTDYEERVLTALRFLEPDIERLAATSQSKDYRYGMTTRGGFKVKFKKTSQPVPIGSLGDGIWRVLAMAISLIKAKNGILLVDEIDTGLHFSVMEDMWKLISETAKEFNVQVFATTHSQDCVESLASICNASDTHAVTIQRIELEKNKSIPFNEAEIRMAATKHIEIR